MGSLKFHLQRDRRLPKSRYSYPELRGPQLSATSFEIGDANVARYQERVQCYIDTNENESH